MKSCRKQPYGRCARILKLPWRTAGETELHGDVRLLLRRARSDPGRAKGPDRPDLVPFPKGAKRDLGRASREERLSKRDVQTRRKRLRIGPERGEPTERGVREEARIHERIHVLVDVRVGKTKSDGRCIHSRLGLEPFGAWPKVEEGVGGHGMVFGARDG